MRGDLVGVVLAHQLGGPLHHPVDTGGADEHVVRLLLEHELTGAAQRVERGLFECAELVLAVPVGEVGEHEEGQPVRRLLVEGAEDARRVEVAGVALQQRLRLLPPVAPEVGVQQVDHRPQVPALLHVDLEQVAQVVEARGGLPEPALLLHRCRLGVALDDDQPLQVGPVLAGHLLPHRLALVLAERDLAVGLRSARKIPQRYSSIARGRSAPSPPGPRRPPCAGTRPGSAPPAPWSSTSSGSSAARTPAPAAAGGPRPGRRCSESSRCSRYSLCLAGARLVS